jgi:hypothetical protein
MNSRPAACQLPYGNYTRPYNTPNPAVFDTNSAQGDQLLGGPKVAVFDDCFTLSAILGATSGCFR